MKIQLVVLVVCLVTWSSAARDSEEERRKPGKPDSGDAQIIRKLERNSETLEKVDNKVQDISDGQKGIESKLRQLGEDLAGIGHLEDDLQKLDKIIADKFQQTVNGLRNLTSSIRQGEDRTDRAISGLARGQQDIKVVLAKVGANQNRYERQLDEVARSVQERITGLDILLKQSVLKELGALVQASKKLEQAQRHIEGKVSHLDELAALNGITANKVQQLESSLRSINRTQHHELAAISHNVQEVGASSWQIDNKLGVLLSTQKNIERALLECKKCRPAPHREHHHKQPEHEPEPEPEPQQKHWNEPGYGYDSDREQNTPKPPTQTETEPHPKTEYESGYANADEASYLYSLWYGTDEK